ncbi:MAG: hypothetical protein V1655_03945 [bacterium]
MYKKIISVITIICLSAPAFLRPVKAAEFNPNSIITDFEYMDYDAMNLDEIQYFLEQKGSGLAIYKTADVDGKIKKASEIIYRAANDYKISPKFILVMLQKEQSLIETANPTDYKLDWAMGFARCDDPILCSPENMAEFQGFAKQVDRGTARQRYYLENAYKDWLKSANNTYDIDGYKITPINQATANLYSYTPHYHGNYNFWKIWNKYFSKNFPDGTLLQADGSDNVWLISYGMRRPFANKAVFSSRFDKNKIITVSENDILKYELGASIKFSNYALMRDSNKNIYLLIDDKKYKIVSPEVFKKLGFISDEIVDLEYDEINEYKDGGNITMDSVYPLGELLRDKKTGGVFYVENGIKNPIWDKQILKTNYPNRHTIDATDEEIEKLVAGWPIKFKDGEIVKGSESPAVYVISDGQRRPIIDGRIFESLGYKWENVVSLDQKILETLHPLGDVIDIGQEDSAEEIDDGTLVKMDGKPSVYLVEDKTLRPIISGNVFEMLGFKWDEIKEISENIAALYNTGALIDENYISSKFAKAGI